MIPTTHLRMYLDALRVPRLQQLWAPMIEDEQTLFYPEAHLIAHGAEWRDMPLVIEPI